MQCCCATKDTIRKWHYSGLELGKVGQFRFLPIFIFTLCHGCFLSTHSSIFYWEFICLFLRAFDLPLHPVTELQSAPIWNHLHGSFQLSDHPRAVLLSNHQPLPQCRGCSYRPNSRISLGLVLWQAQLGCTAECEPLLFSSSIFSFFSSGIFSLCALVSLLLPPEKQPGAALYHSGKELLPSCLSAAPARIMPATKKELMKQQSGIKMCI